MSHALSIALCTLGISIGMTGALRADVLTVDSDPGAGADFLDIQPAVDAATDGDVLLISDGVYSGFTLDARSLLVVADDNSATIGGHVVIKNLGANQRASLLGLSITPPKNPDPYVWPPQPAAVVVRNNLGAVRFERCTILAPSFPVDGGFCDSFTLWLPGTDGLEIGNSEQVVLESCLLEGGYGVDAALNFLCLDGGSEGGRALVIDSSKVGLHNVIARGADGAYQGQGGNGGKGVELLNGSDVLASGVVAEGGDGGLALDFIGFEGQGSGGDGLSADGTSTLRLLGGVYAGGAPGSTCCWTNFPGAPRAVDGTQLDYPSSPHRFLTSGPAREGEALTLSITGGPGDLAFLFMGFEPLFLSKPALAGTVYIAPPFAFGPKLLATLEGGITNIPIVIPELGPGFDALVVDMQLYMIEQDGDEHLTSPAQAVLLDAAL